LPALAWFTASLACAKAVCSHGRTDLKIWSLRYPFKLITGLAGFADGRRLL